MKHIIVTGNPIDGFKFYGPFETHEDAMDYADGNLIGDKDWWIVELQEPA